ncbi:MAG: tail fiber domain-containing protein [candidate division Zixibacteria bacterium]|nr:tail fiber domain-containing protein [candidate division Zixibacteria bacterium]
MKAVKILLVCLVAILFISTLAYAEVPKMINYQGKITRPSGALVDTTTSVVFSIYADSIGGTALWTETQTSVGVQYGVFSVLLGSVTPIPDSVFDGNVRYLGVKVGNDSEMTPRRTIVSVGYAFKSDHTDTAEYAKAAPAMPDADWVIDGNDIYHVPGNVGIGTTNPAYKLDVNGDIRSLGTIYGNVISSINSDMVDGYHAGNASGQVSVSNGVICTNLNSDLVDGNHYNSNWPTTLTNVRSACSNDFHNIGGTDDDVPDNDAEVPDDISVNNGRLFAPSGSGNVGIGITIPNEQLEISGNLRLPTTTSTAGIIKAGADRFIHNYGTRNTFVGVNAGNLTMTGNANAANGYMSLNSNTSGYQNTANGCYALSSNTTGDYNTANGWGALYSNTSGYQNTANGMEALYFDTTGYRNTANGHRALYSNTTGSNNTALGCQADVSSGNLTNATAIGYGAVVDASNKVRIGNSSVTVIEGQVNWSTPSDARMKTNVQESHLGLDFILKLRPITYSSLAGGQENITYTGLIAQEVEKALQEIGTDFSGLDKPKNEDGFYQLRYAEFVMPLIKAIQDQQEQIKTLKQRIEELEKK